MKKYQDDINTSIEDNMEVSLLDKQKVMFTNNPDKIDEVRRWWNSKDSFQKHIIAEKYFKNTPHTMLSDTQIEQLFILSRDIDRVEYNPLFDSEHDRRRNPPCTKS